MSSTSHEVTDWIVIEKWRKEAETRALTTDAPQDLKLDAAILAAFRSLGLQGVEIDALILQPMGESSAATPVSNVLNQVQSERAYRVQSLLHLAERVFGDRTKAFFWLRMPNERLGNKTPMSRIETELGARLVEEMLLQLDYGIAA